MFKRYTAVCSRSVYLHNVWATNKYLNLSKFFRSINKMINLDVILTMCVIATQSSLSVRMEYGSTYMNVIHTWTKYSTSHQREKPQAVETILEEQRIRVEHIHSTSTQLTAHSSQHTYTYPIHKKLLKNCLRARSCSVGQCFSFYHVSRTHLFLFPI